MLGVVAMATAAHAACPDSLGDMKARIGADWIDIKVGYQHPDGAAMNLQCNEGEPLRAYVQVPVEGSDVDRSQKAVAKLAEDLMLVDVAEKDVRRCILAVKPTIDEDIWLGVRMFGKAFECGKDKDSHYFRIAPGESPFRRGVGDGKAR